MAITSKGTSPSPSRDEQKLGGPEGQTPSDPALTPDNVAAKLGRVEGQSPPNVDLSPDPAAAKRPGEQGTGARRQ
jgi:hypothetical protein